MYSVVTLNAGIGHKGDVTVECPDEELKRALPKLAHSGLVVVSSEVLTYVLNSVPKEYELVTISETQDENYHTVTVVFKKAE